MTIHSVTVWTLNQATNLIAREESSSIARLFKLGGPPPYLQCTFGERGSRKSHRLMNEGPSFGGDPTNEYFVPIPLKCLGDRYRTAPAGNGRVLLEGIRSMPAYDYFRERSLFEAYWSPRPGQGSPIQMSTPQWMGYYDLLPRGGNNILIGYSQGGLVARYLAFLDEYVFQEGRIAGVITLHAPNHGSPLAHPSNRENITRSIVDSIMTIVALLPDRYVRTRGRLQRLQFEELYALMDELFLDLDGLRANGALSKEEESLHGTMSSALKWLSGIQPMPFPTAFSDLGTHTYADEFSVLSLVYRYPLKRIVSGAIVGSNGRLDTLAAGLLGTALSTLFSGLIKPLGTELGKNLQRASAIYADHMMKDALDSVPPRTWATGGVADPIDFLRNYESGYKTRSVTLPEKAHDFVIPSLSQTLFHDERSVGVLVNTQANHDSGKERGTVGSPNPAGMANFKLLLELLGRMKQRLATGS